MPDPRSRPLVQREIFQARQRIGSLIRHTPTIASPLLAERAGGAVSLKLETLQETGSFKIRGAANRMLSLPAEQRQRGVIAVSSGNHGRAVAHIARRLGIESHIYLSKHVPDSKAAAIEALGARVVVTGASYDEAEAASFEAERAQRLTRIPPFDDAAVIAGQGTIGLELLEEIPTMETVVVPLSGGGLIAGIALACKTADPAIRVIGVSMERAPVMALSLQAGRPIEVPEEVTLADGLAGGIGLENAHTFHMVQALVDDVVLVSEEEIAEAMGFMLRAHHQVVEGAGAVGVAALLAGKVQRAGRTIVVVSGGNVALATLLEVIGARPADLD